MNMLCFATRNTDKVQAFELPGIARHVVYPDPKTLALMVTIDERGGIPVVDHYCAGAAAELDALDAAVIEFYGAEQRYPKPEWHYLANVGRWFSVTVPGVVLSVPAAWNGMLPVTAQADAMELDMDALGDEDRDIYHDVQNFLRSNFPMTFRG